SQASPLLDHLIRTCLEKNPDQRWQSAADILIQLQLASRMDSTLKNVVAERRVKVRERLAWSLVTAILVVIAIVAAVWPSQTLPPQALMQFEIPTPRTGYPGHIAFSPDG